MPEFMKTAFELVGKNWHDYVTIDQHLTRLTDMPRR